VSTTDVFEPTALEQAGFSEDEIELIREAGLLSAGPLAESTEPWRPQTLADVDWLCWRLKQLETEAAAIRAQADRRVDALLRSAAVLRHRYEADCRAVVEEHLPRRKDGTPAKKSLDLERVRVKLRTVPGGTKVVDPAALLAHLRVTEPEQLWAFVPALKATRTQRCEGLGLVPLVMAPEIAEQEGWTFTLSAAEVRRAIEQLPHRIDPETGEDLGPATVPGVEVIPPRESFGWE